MIMVKKTGLGPLKPVTSVNNKYISLQRASTELIQTMMREGTFSDADRLLALREERRDG